MRFVYAGILVGSVVLAFWISTIGRTIDGMADLFSAETMPGTILFAALIFTVLALTVYLMRFIWGRQRQRRRERAISETETDRKQ